MGQPLEKNEIPLHSMNPCLSFEICEINFVGPFWKRGKIKGVKYIITTVEYITKWAQDKMVKLCMKVVMAKFIYEKHSDKIQMPLNHYQR